MLRAVQAWQPFEALEPVGQAPQLVGRLHLGCLQQVLALRDLLQVFQVQEPVLGPSKLPQAVLQAAQAAASLQLPKLPRLLQALQVPEPLHPPQASQVQVPQQVPLPGTQLCMPAQQLKH